MSLPRQNVTMVTSKEELLASHIRKQIAFLEGLIKELETVSAQDKNITLRIQDVELQLKELRNKL